MKTTSDDAPKMERRIALLARIAVVEVRQDDGNVAESVDTSQLIGHAAVFDKLSEELWGFREKISRGAFTRAIKEKQDVIALREHDPSLVLGRSSSGTLTLEEDEIGLRATIEPPDTELGRETVELVKRGDLRHMSFGFMVKKESFEERDDGTIVRTLEDVDLFDVSVVGFPAYPQTDVGLGGDRSYDVDCRSFNEWQEARRRKFSTRYGRALIRQSRARLAGRKILDIPH